MLTNLAAKLAGPGCAWLLFRPICVLDDGRVTGEGTHDILVAGGGPYAHLAALQFGPVQECA